MTSHIPDAIAEQLRLACDVIGRQLAANLLAIHLYGSALDGGLKPRSDIDLLVIAAERPDQATLRHLQRTLLAISAPPGQHRTLRALEATLIVRGDVVPWRHPARREWQFGEWLRQDILAEILEPPTHDPDIAILLTKAHQHSIALHGPALSELLQPVPQRNFLQALADTLTLWNGPDDWRDEEANIVLTLSRIWYSAQTGRIAPKDVAADWLLQRLPDEHHTVVASAREVYLGQSDSAARWPAAQMAAFIHFAKARISEILPPENS
ncbi:aminoglycoside adenylyltransferase family protein [Stenotrophomonas sp. Iso1]|uniref:aminoglycoside adenylyltransferase family protein n=1 Tax=Stenotrophomonas sp. Iso1 TaxID=2977283 RepID=UPI0022B79842|nr:aminoglycoside adenylyltransferase family protein [Stenotrophomonas sp. Iso1]